MLKIWADTGKHADIYMYMYTISILKNEERYRKLTDKVDRKTLKHSFKISLGTKYIVHHDHNDSCSLNPSVICQYIQTSSSTYWKHIGSLQTIHRTSNRKLHEKYLLKNTKEHYWDLTDNLAQTTLKQSLQISLETVYIVHHRHNDSCSQNPSVAHIENTLAVYKQYIEQVIGKHIKNTFKKHWKTMKAQWKKVETPPTT